MKYKLIKSYPNSRETGTIVSPVPQPDTASKTSRYIDSSGRYYGWHEVEDYPEYWEEVKDSQFKVGDWVVDTRDDEVYRVTSIEGEKNERIFGARKYGWNHYSYLRLATKKEIEKYLIEEAKKRGYAKGVRVKCLHNWSQSDDNILHNGTLTDDRFIYYDNDELWVGGKESLAYVIYDKGKWAEIVKEEPIMIAGYKAEYDRDHQVHFGCKTYSQESINQLVSVMNIFDIVRFDTNKAHNVEYAVVRKVQNNFK